MAKKKSAKGSKKEKAPEKKEKIDKEEKVKIDSEDEAKGRIVVSQRERDEIDAVVDAFWLS